MTENYIVKMECISCKHFYEYPNGGSHCFMKHNIYLINNENVYPKVCEDYERRAENDFPTILNRVTFVDTGRKPSIEETKKQLMNQELLISDEEAFEKHLIRKWMND